MSLIISLGFIEGMDNIFFNIGLLKIPLAHSYHPFADEKKLKDTGESAFVCRTNKLQSFIFSA